MKTRSDLTIATAIHAAVDWLTGPATITDRSPCHVRDLGTIFFLQAAVRMSKTVEKG